VNKKILIVGAGIAGLSAGIHACRNGYETEIYEMHTLPGGLCTAWERKGYTFDGCIHWLVGTKPGSQFNRLWREVCDIDAMEMIESDRFITIEGNGGKTLHIFNDIDRLESHLLEYSPQDEAVIKELAGAARSISRMEFPLEKPNELIKFWDIPLIMVKMLPMFKIMGKFSRVTIAEYLRQIKDPFLKEALSLLIPPCYSMLSLLSTLASHHAGDAGFPKGGSLAFARSLERRFTELGGKVHYGSPVSEIIIENDRAVGVTLADGRQVRADTVISAADLFHSTKDLLKGKYTTKLIKDSFKNLATYSSVQVSLGIDCDLSAEAKKLAVRLEKPISIGAEENLYLYITNYSFDSSLAPPGKSVVTGTLYSSFEPWSGAAKNKELYREKKEKLARQVVKAVEERFTAARGNVEAIDVATPYSFYRYTKVYKGAYMAWIVPPDSGRFKIPKQLPNLKDYYQIGQWVEPPAGLPGSMLTGRHVIQLICRRDHRVFRKK
jgi:phytoene dehydrogenase-like protein